MILALTRLRLSQKLLAIAFLPVLVTIVSFLFYVLMNGDGLLHHPVMLTVVLGLPVGYFIIVVFFIKKLTAPITAIRDAIVSISLGKPAPSIATTETTDIATIAEAMNSLNHELINKAEFAGQISAGNLTIAYQPVSSADLLGHSLLTMRDNLVRVKEEDQKRNWTTGSLASFVEVLRIQKNLKALSNDIIINLVQILKANQGAIFIISQEDPGSSTSRCRRAMLISEPNT